MQRLGFLKCVTSLASSANSQTLEALTKNVETTIRKQVELTGIAKGRFAEYVSRFRLTGRYPDTLVSRVELQDAYLSDPALPSGTGAITGEIERVGYRHAVYVEIPTWAGRLDLIRDRNYTLTDRGKILNILSAAETWQAYDPTANPFGVNRAQAFFFLYCLLSKDGDVLRIAYRTLLDSKHAAFERAQLGSCIAQALDELLRTKLRNRTSGAAQITAQKISKTVQSISKQRGTGYGPRESVATPRAEPLVDCGLLRKPDPTSYVYEFTELGTGLLTQLAKSDSITSFIREDLSTAISGVPAPTMRARLSSVEHVYQLLKSGLGYVSIRELVVGSIAVDLEAGRPVYSIRALEDMIFAAPASYGPLVRLAQGRVGGIAQVRIHSDAFRAVSNEQ